MGLLDLPVSNIKLEFISSIRVVFNKEHITPTIVHYIRYLKMAVQLPKLPEITRLSSRVIRILAGNPEIGRAHV